MEFKKIVTKENLVFEGEISKDKTIIENQLKLAIKKIFMDEEERENLLFYPEKESEEYYVWDFTENEDFEYDMRYYLVYERKTGYISLEELGFANR